jgi:hypothetical protein
MMYKYHVVGFSFAVALTSCKSKREKIVDFFPADYRDVKDELKGKFGQPDSIVAFCNGDTSYLYRDIGGCAEWRFMAKDIHPYRAELNDTCKIEEARFELYDYVPKKRRYPANPGIDSNGWQINPPFDSAIGITKFGRWPYPSFVLTNRDTGGLKKYFQVISSLEIEKKKSVRDVHCRKKDFLIRFKYGESVGRIMLGASNFPDASYDSLLVAAKGAAETFLRLKASSPGKE